MLLGLIIEVDIMIVMTKIQIILIGQHRRRPRRDHGAVRGLPRAEDGGSRAQGPVGGLIIIVYIYVYTYIYIYIERERY